MSNFLELIQGGKWFAKSPQLDETDLTAETDSALPKAFWARMTNNSILYHMNLVIQAAQEYFATKKTISFVSGTQHYDIPGNAIKIRYLEKVDCDPDEVIKPISIDQRLKYTGEEDSTDDDDGSDHYAYLWGNLIGIVPNMDTGTGSVNVLIIRRLPDLSYGTVTGTPTQIEFILPATPTLGKTSIEDDYYNDATLRIISATTGAGQTSLVTDYVGSTRALTVDFDTAPSNDAVYDFICDIPLEYHPAISLYSAILARARDNMDMTAVKELHNDLITQMLIGLAPRWDTKNNIVQYKDV